ncbi:MAG: MBOAT family protein [Lachnospiraceae bacterium]|nr:MBOAT family protein [Lachnospiraceae bacterium]
MVFSSAVFLLIFLPVFLTVYYLLPFKIKNAWLLLASLVFYAWGEPVYVFLMMGSIAVNYFAGLLLSRFAGHRAAMRALLTVSVAVHVGALFFFKYSDFLISAINGSFGAGLRLMGLALPIGISFYTFQALSYVIDVYRGKVSAQKNLIDFGAYISMFPQLIAGPIVRYSDVAARLRERSFDADRAFCGILRFCVGLGKKVLLANSLGAFWEEISAAGGAPAMTTLIGAVCFSLQIYFDFSGYSDMAIGIGRMLGFEFSENFNYPYMAKSITDFWRRWHISLGSWFREYVYIPLGGSRKGLPRQILNLLIVWALTGIWHGAGWNFLFWGLYFFVLLTIEKICAGRVRLPGAAKRIYTLVAVLVSWIIFATPDIGAAGNMIGNLFGANGFANAGTLYYLRNCSVLLAIGLLFSTNIVRRLLRRLAPGKAKSAVLECAAVLLYALSLIMVINSAYNPFLYFRF